MGYTMLSCPCHIKAFNKIWHCKNPYVTCYALHAVPVQQCSERGGEATQGNNQMHRGEISMRTGGESRITE